MFRKHSRIIATVVMCLFTWTSGGLFSVAHAAQATVEKGATGEPQPKKPEGAEERFGKLTEELTAGLANPKVSVAAKRERLKSARAEIAAIDPEIRKSFAATEKWLKDAKLPDD